MAEWLFEDGIGEARAALVERGEIVEARIDLPGPLRLGGVLAARLRERQLAVTDTGDELWLDRAPTGVTLGARINVEITREAIPEPGRPKRPRGRVTDAPTRAAAALIDQLGGAPVRTLRPHEADALEEAGWSELLEEARTGDIAFDGGALRLWPTPAMALFDVDGDGPLDRLAQAAATAAARAIRRHGIGGSIGIDFPTLDGKVARQAVAAMIDTHLPPPFERTAVNGFGFLQIVRPRHRASLPELLRADPVGTAARQELRRLEREPRGSAGGDHVPDAVRHHLLARPDWLGELVRRTGRVPIWAR